LRTNTDRYGEFLGVGIGSEAVPICLKRQLEEIAEIIGNKYYELRYRGFFDVDFVISKTGVPYAIETNNRRTGGTHVYDIGKRVFGNNNSHWGYLLSEDYLVYGDRLSKDESILERVSDLMFRGGGSKKGIIITLLGSKDPFLGYVAVGQNKRETMDFQVQFKRLLQVS